MKLSPAPILLSIQLSFLLVAASTPGRAADSPLRTQIRIATAGLNADMPASTILDFSLSAVAAKELATKR